MSPPASAPLAGAGRGGTPDDSEEYRRGGWGPLLRNRRFVLLQTTGALAGAGYAVYSVSVLFLAYAITNNLLVAGAVLFIEYGVYTGTFLVAPLVDRARDKRTVLLLCYPVQAAAAACLWWTLHTGTLSVPVLLALVFVLSLGWDFVWAVFMIGPRIVVEKRQLFAADGIAGVLAVGTTVGGYAGGGALLFLVGPDGGALAYLVLLSAAFFVALPLSLPVERAPATPFVETFRQGWASFRGRVGAPLRQFAALEVVYGFFSGVPPLLITSLAYVRFSSPSAVYGPLVAAFSVGGAAAGIVLGHLNPRRSIGLLLVGLPIGAGALVLGLTLFPASVVLLGLALAGVGAAIAARYNAKYNWVRASYPTEQLGRLVSNLYFFTGFSASAAVLFVGETSRLLSLPALLGLDGAGLIASGFLAAGLPFVRRLAY